MSEASEAGPAPAAAKPTVLIIDDQPENLAVLAGLLQAHYCVRAARSGETGLRAAVSEPRPDLILLDIMMPDMDGYAVLTRLRGQPATRDTPVIFVTAMGAEEDEQRGFDLGAVDYITKPIKPAVVQARVRAHLELKTARDALAGENARLEARVAERTLALRQALDKTEAAHASLKKAHFATLMAISRLAELRGGSIGEHGRRVADLARRVAMNMGMDEAETQDVFIAALLHDVGKIGFPDGLLDKPVGAMSGDDLAVYRRHPLVGAEALGKLEIMTGVADIIRHHHENYDGSGFPEGRSALDIPLGARIIAAASDYDNLKYGALTVQPMTAKQSFEYLLEESGRRYDPQVIGHLERILSREEGFEIDEMAVTAPHLHEGMILSRDVLHPGGFVLLSSGATLSRRLIDQLVAVEGQTGKPLRIFVHRRSGGD